MIAKDAADVVRFWREAGPSLWFKGGEAFDDECRRRLEPLHHAAARDELARWMDDGEGALGLLLLLDQIPRNIYRGSGHAFATDGLARKYAVMALEAGHDARCDETLRPFFYLPFEHAESMADQERAVALFDALGNTMMYDYAIRHRDVIAQFGRFPHRNAALGRANTPEEQAYLDAGGGF